MMPIDMKCIRNTFVFLVVLGTTLPLQGFGQENKSSFSMTIPQAVAFAIENHPDVKNANLEIAVASAKISELVAVGLPQVNLGIDVNNFVEIPTQFVPAEFFGGDAGTYAPVKFGQPWSSSAGVTASQLLFDGSYLIGVKATKVYKELSEKTAEQLKIEMAVNITKSYYMVLVATEKSKQLKGDLEQLDKIRRDTKKLYEKGFAEKVDLDRLDLNYNLLENAISHTDRMVVDGYNLLKFQMGMDLQHELILTEPVPEASNFNSLVETTGIDYNQRIEYSILQTQYRLTELDYKRYQSMRWPSVVAFGSYSTNASRNEFNLLQSGYKWYPTSIVGASIKMPLFAGFKNKYQTEQARLRMQMVENGSIKLEQGMELEYRTAVSKLNKSIEDLQLQSKNRDLAKEIVRITKIKYEKGVGSSFELVQAETSSREAESNYYAALLSAAVAKTELDKSMGKFKY